MELRAFVVLIKRRWATIAGLVVIGLLAAVTFSALQTPVYTSTATSLVSTPAATNASDLQSGSVFTQQVVTTYAEVATTAYVLDSVIASLNLDIDAEDLAKDVSASAPASTSVIEITVKSSSASLAAAIANGVAAELASRAPEVTPSTVAGTSAITISTIQPAVEATSPTSPNWLINVALGLLVGLFVGVGVVVIRDTTDPRLRSAEEAAQLTGLPILGGIAYDRRERTLPLISSKGAHPLRIESYRALRTTLQFVNLAGFSRAYVVASPSEGEGKSTTTVNAAIVFADAGKRVVVLDADIRQPRIAQLFGVYGGVGLVDVLRGEASLDDVLQVAPDNHVVVLPAGRMPITPVELIQPAAIAEILGQLKERFDVVLVDAPPVLSSTDSVILTQQSDGAILIAAQGRVERAELAAAAAALTQVGAPVLGIVVRLMRGAGRGAVARGAVVVDRPERTSPTRVHADS